MFTVKSFHLFHLSSDGYAILRALVHFDSMMLWIRSALDETLLNVIVVQLAADEHDLADARLVRLPLALAGAELDLIMHSLEHELCVALIVEGQHALGAVQVNGFLFQERGHELVEANHVQVRVNGVAHGRHEREIVALLDALLRVLMAVLVTMRIFALLMTVCTAMLIMSVIMAVTMLMTVRVFAWLMTISITVLIVHMSVTMIMTIVMTMFMLMLVFVAMRIFALFMTVSIAVLIMCVLMTVTMIVVVIMFMIAVRVLALLVTISTTVLVVYMLVTMTVVMAAVLIMHMIVSMIMIMIVVILIHESRVNLHHLLQ